MSSQISIEELQNATESLKEALTFAEQSKNNLIQFKIARDACIQRFEYCIELSWKVAVKKLGSQTKFAKPAIREMARADLIKSAELWLDFIEARNESSHSYSENVAKVVFEKIKKYAVEVDNLLITLKKLP